MKTSTTAERLKMILEQRKMKQVDILRLVEPYCKQYNVKMDRSHISQYVSGKVEPSQEKLTVLGLALGVSETWLMGYDGNTSLPANLLPVKKVRVPLLGNVAAGAPILADQEYDTYIEANEDIRCDFALRVDGDSMEPTVRYGDLVFIRQQDDVDDGEIAAVLVDDSATLKHVYHIRDGLQLISDNPKYRPMIFTLPEYDTIRIIGKAVAFKRIL